MPGHIARLCPSLDDPRGKGRAGPKGSTMPEPCGYVILGGGLNPRTCERRTRTGSDRCEKHPHQRPAVTFCAVCHHEWPCPEPSNIGA